METGAYEKDEPLALEVRKLDILEGAWIERKQRMHQPPNWLEY